MRSVRSRRAGLTAARTDALERVRAYYERRASEGVVLSPDDLAEYCARERIEPAPGVDELREMRSHWRALATHAHWRGPPTHMGALFETLGNVMVDVAEMEPRLRRFNGGAAYFLTAKDCLSELLGVVPLANKTRQSWQAAVESVCDTFPAVKTIISDQDVAISSAAFRRELRERRNVGWAILRSRSKSFKAERAQRFLKDRLGQAMGMAADDPGTRNRWVAHLPAILEDYNSRNVTGTDIRRRDVDESNYLEVLEQRFGRSRADFEPLQSAESFSRRLYGQLFRYSPGDRVVVSRSATYGAPSSETAPGGAFLKRSLKGAYAPAVHVVKSGSLRTAASGAAVPVYHLTGLAGPFYETELSLVTERERRAPPAREEEEAAADAGPRRSERLRRGP
jgi:hypothetical protein